MRDRYYSIDNQELMVVWSVLNTQSTDATPPHRQGGLVTRWRSAATGRRTNIDLDPAVALITCRRS